MNNDEWREILNHTKKKIEVEIGIMLGNIELKKTTINNNIEGVIGGVRGELDIYHAAKFIKTSNRIEVRELQYKPSPSSVNVTVKKYISVPLHLESFSALAGYLLLHEAGHMHYNHLQNGDDEEKEADDFAAKHMHLFG